METQVREYLASVGEKSNFVVTTNSDNYLLGDRYVKRELGCQCALPGQQVCPSYNSVYPHVERRSCFAQQVIYPITVTSAFMLD